MKITREWKDTPTGAAFYILGHQFGGIQNPEPGHAEQKWKAFDCAGGRRYLIGREYPSADAAKTAVENRFIQ